ncbi:MAG: glycosyltransferase family 39 protein [Campylobacterota bacterium]|nr:glycosyltransferase family 39 protein [Campylobacterota bacterium]
MITSYKKEINAVLIIGFFKLLILFLLPLTGDEAYFITWAKVPLAGYYDHPPMVGWLIYLMSFISESHIFYRFFSFIATLIIAYVIYTLSKLHVKKELAFLVALAFLASPIDVLLVLFTNDIPLVLFGSLGTLFLIFSLEKNRWFMYAVLAGLFLGLAFLSKYFAAFLMIGLLIFSLISYRTRALKTIAVVVPIILAFVAQNLYFNYNSCWNNILFNFFARTQDSSYSVKGMIGLTVSLVYILAPWGIYYLFKERSHFKNSILLTLLGSILIFTLAIFSLVALKKSVGLHWLLLFVPYLFLLFSFLNESYLRKIIRFNARFTYIHIALVTLVLLTPISLFKEHKRYSDAVLLSEPQKICKALDEHNLEKLYGFGYSMTSLLSYHCSRDIKVLYNSNKYGRFDDKLINVRTLNNQDLTFIDKRNIYAPYLESTCKNSSVENIKIHNANFYILRCESFDYEAYKNQILSAQKERFYTIPEWLPVGECYFLDRYYP